MKKIVIDTNVLVAALRSSQGTSYKLLRLLASESNPFKIQVSVPLVAEYDEVLARNFSNMQTSHIVDYLCKIAEHHKIFYLWRPTLKDADDDFILELAVKSHSYIITWNVKDFVMAKKFGIHVMTPKQLLNLAEKIDE